VDLKWLGALCYFKSVTSQFFLLDQIPQCMCLQTHKKDLY